MIKIIPVINNKGGVGKTTTTVNVAAGLARHGDRVLVVDLDSQASASLALGIDRDNLPPSTAAVLFGEASMAEAVRETGTENVDVLTGSMRLADTDTRLSSTRDRERHLERALSQVEDRYDTVLIDCAPSTSLLTVNALVAADAFIIPVAPSYLSLEGVVSLGQVVSSVRQSVGEAAPVLGVLLTMVQRDDERTEAIVREVERHYGGKVFDTKIGRYPAIEEAPGYGKSIFDYAPDTPGAKKYGSLVKEVISRRERYGSVYGTIHEKQSDRSST